MLNAAQFRSAVTEFAPQNVGQLQNANTDWFSLIDRTGYGQEHNLALRNDGSVWAWGANVYGQLGDGTSLTRNIPVRVSGIANAVAIAAGGEHSIALRSDGTVAGWGRNDLGQLGDGTNLHRRRHPAIRC